MGSVCVGVGGLATQVGKAVALFVFFSERETHCASGEPPSSLWTEKPAGVLSSSSIS